MAEAIKVEVKDAKRLFFRVRGRFLKLQREIVGEALQEASEPIVQAARQLAPKGTGKRSRASRLYGPLATSISGVLLKPRGLRVTLQVTPARVKSAGFPFYGLFQERGWKATGRRKRGTAKNPRFIPGKHFLERAGKQNFAAAERIFAARVFQRFAQIQEAGGAAGL